MAPAVKAYSRLADPRPMSDRPSILVLDDGELDNVHRMLLDLELDAVRLKGSEIKQSVEALARLHEIAIQHGLAAVLPGTFERLVAQ